MNRFEKVSKETFVNSIKGLFDETDAGVVEECAGNLYNNIKLPCRSTVHSAGYDFFTPITIELHPRESTVLPTGIKVYLDDDKWLGIYPRSGLGFKYQLGLANTIGVIDSDYVDNTNNEGQIMLKLVNNGEKTCCIEANKAVAQGIIQSYYVVDNEADITTQRTGGIGSTNA